LAQATLARVLPCAFPRIAADSAASRWNLEEHLIHQVEPYG